MNVSKLLKTGLLAVVCVGMLCACGGNASGENGAKDTEHTPQTQTEIQSEPQTETTEQTEAKELSFADLYEQTDLDRVYKLSNIDTDGYGIGQAYLNDGYVLLLMQDYSEEGYVNEGGEEHLMVSGKLVLFPLAHPDEAASRDMDRVVGQYQLLADGRVMKTDWNGDYTLYDSKLEELQKGTLDCQRMLGATDEGDIWAVAETSVLALHRDGKEVKRVPVEDAALGSFLGEQDNKAYFSLADEGYNNFLASIDLTDDSVERQHFLYESFAFYVNYDFFHGWLNYGSEDKWYLANMTDLNMVTAFDKQYSDEYIWKQDDNYLISTRYCQDDSDTYRQILRAYRTDNGGFCGEQVNVDLVSDQLLLYDMDQGIVLYGDSTPELATKGLYLWDLNGLEAEEPAENYAVIDYHVDQARIDAMIQEIYDRYGVSVYYDQEHLDWYQGDFALHAYDGDIELLGRALIRLMECMAEYPEGFFEELKHRTEEYNDVVFYLVDHHEQVSEFTINDALGTVNADNGRLQMSLDIHDWWGLRRTFLHENMHMMDAVLEPETYNLYGRNIYEYWYNVMNNPEMASMQNYHFDKDDEANMKGIYSIQADPEDVWYIDAYSKSTMNEDRARILEQSIYSASESYFKYPHLERKLRHLNALIRDTFECVKNTDEPVLWEALTGIVDLKEEFPDFP